MIRAVVLDFYGTLAPGRSADRQAAARTAQAAALGIDARAFDAELTATVEERFRGAGGTVEGSLAWVARRLGVEVDAARLAEAARIRLAGERAFGEPRPEAVPMLTEVRARGLRTAVISDCSAELPAYFASLPIAELIDVATFSFVLGVRKPDPRIYLSCCADLGVEPAQCLYVGDGGSNELPGARAVGMRAVHLAVPDEAGGVVYGRHDDWDGETITSLDQVPDLC